MNKLPVILIVDDDDMNIAMAKSILENNVRAEIITASSGNKCLDILSYRQGAIDLILLDIAMPGMDGLQTLSVIRKNPAYKNMKVIFLTAAADKNTIVKASQLKVDDYVKKPFVPADLIARVKKHMFAPVNNAQVDDIFKALDKLGL
ncbi:putative response regulator receiver protein [Selenomonas ruminantium subsp. lactilytica TAM6421]|uniref:Putative response regulator receiver protein n=1 Tax=Selenomonas ruminantium subsp. lactilytica (strain NBRC 103574 / TAM6421) TaxID=927704 RepID=I0GUI0_SELRL|nr:response regulator [Selenomonas ruminantium]BAL84417.1 putative response regulator receiver protein [Selenomonas ruminantium subsp. lactilytica TAM6421]